MTRATFNGAPLEGLLRSAPPTDPVAWRRCDDCLAPMAWDGRTCTGRERHRAAAPPIQLYARRTGTQRNLKALAAHGWALLATPEDAGRYARTEPPWRYALDNGAWSAHQRGERLDLAAFQRAVDQLGVLADWIVLPDIVEGGGRSLELSLGWLERLRGVGTLLLIAVQDGMQLSDVAPHLGADVGLFIGGSTAWKLSMLPAWCRLGRERGAHVHVGRVNTQRRIALARSAGASSADGTSATLFSVNAGPLAHEALRPETQALLPCLGGSA